MKRYALLLGTSIYNEFNNLECVKNDINDFYKLLIESGDYKKKNVLKLLDEEEIQKVRVDIEEFLSKVENDDYILFYYSGHAIIDDDTSKMYFTMMNTKNKTFRSTSLEKDFILDCLESNKPKSRVFIIDCCYSGVFVAGMNKSVHMYEYKDSKINVDEILKYTRGWCVLSSSRKGQESTPGEKYSLYTGIMLQGLKSCEISDNFDGKIYPDDIHNYVTSIINEISEQIPQFNKYNIEGIEEYHILTIKQDYNKLMAEYIKEINRINSYITVFAGKGDNNKFKFKMENVYIPLSMSERCITEKNKKSQLEIGREFNKIEAEGLLNIESKRIIVKGKAGMGKSTLLKYLSWKISSGNNLIPVIIKLSDYFKKIDDDIDLVEYIKNKLRIEGSTISKKFIDQCLLIGKFLLLFDGLDEVKGDKNEILKILKKFSNMYECKIIVTSRDNEYKFENFTDYIYQIDDLSEKLAEEYIHNSFSVYFEGKGYEKLSNNLLNKIKENKNIYDLAKNPFLLSMLCFIGKDKPLPDKRVELYRVCTGILLDYRNNEEIYYKCKNRVVALKEIAYKFFIDEIDKFDKESMCTIIDKLIEECKKLNCDGCDENLFLNKITQESGILQQVEFDIYEFVHRSFFEYFLSKKLVELSIDEVVSLGSNDNGIKELKFESIRLYAAQLKKKYSNKFICNLWKSNKELALKCFPEMDYLEVKTIVNLYNKANLIEKAEFIKGLKYVDTKSESNDKKLKKRVFDFLEKIFETETDIEVLCHGVLILEDIINNSLFKENRERASEIIKIAIGTKEDCEIRYKRYIEKYMVKIPKGEFVMGSPEGESFRCAIWNSDKGQVYEFENELQHEVSLDEFFISKYPVTFGIFKDFIENEKKYTSNVDKSRGSMTVNIENGKWTEKNGVDWKNDIDGSNQTNLKKPVIHISWYEAYMFTKLMGCKLPTEAQWEYVCRGNIEKIYNTKSFNSKIGIDLTTEEANYDGKFSYTNKSGKFRGTLTFVDAFDFINKNKFEVYDMHGNTYEWCMDWYDQDYYFECNNYGIITNPMGPKNGIWKVFRGGSWIGSVAYCRSASRCSAKPNNRYFDVSFRIVLNL